MTETEEIIRAGFPARPVDAHKYSVGTVAIAGGSAEYPHAPVIAGMGARAAGAGLVRLAVPAESRPCAGAWLPEATFAAFGEGEPLPKADVLVIGNGLGRSSRTDRLVRRCLAEWDGPLVLDADALHSLATGAGEGVASRPGLRLALTPHEGEAARLLGRTREEIAGGRAAAAAEIAAHYGATVALKGPRTLVVSAAGAETFENPAGNPAMALGGMGDLLAGVIGARWARLKGEAFVAVAAGVWLHSAAADRLVEEGGDPSLANVAEAIGRIRMALERG